MSIPGFSKYHVEKDGTVTHIPSGQVVPEIRNRKGRRAVVIKNDNSKKSSQPLDRLVLRTYKPLPEGKDSQWSSVKFLDGNRDNVHVDNLEWDETWYTPSFVPLGPDYLNTWYPIPGYDNLEIMLGYGGLIRSSVTGNVYKRIKTETYDQVQTTDHGLLLFHRSVALTFLPHPIDTDHLVVNHKNSNKRDNSIDNLEWATYGENNQHAFDEGGRSQSCKRIMLFDIETKEVLIVNSINAAARLLGSNPGIIFEIVNRRVRKNKPYKGYLIKREDDPSTWLEMLSDDGTENSQRSEIAVRDFRTGEVRVYPHFFAVMKGENIYRSPLYRLLSSDVVIPWRGRGFQVVTPDMTWPEYPKAIIDIFENVERHVRPLEITYPDGRKEYSASVTQWCLEDRENRCDPAVLSREIAKRGYWRDIKFEYLDLKRYHV